MNARLALAALLLAASAFASAAERTIVGCGDEWEWGEWDCPLIYIPRVTGDWSCSDTDPIIGCGSINIGPLPVSSWNGTDSGASACDGYDNCGVKNEQLRFGAAAVAAGFTADWTDAQLERAMAIAVKTREGVGKPAIPKAEAEPAKAPGTVAGPQAEPPSLS